MNRKQELLLIIKQLNKDLCDYVSYLNKEYKVLNAENVNVYKRDFLKYSEIHTNLKQALAEYDSLKQ